nr:Hpt domain-containing protein [Pseudomonas aegrilactucae]
MGDLYVKLLDTFLEDCEVRIAQLQQAKDADGLGYAAHSFKGSCSNMGAMGLAELCRQLEERIKVQPLCGIEDLINQIGQEYHLIRPAYEAERTRAVLESAGHPV